ncbi:MAG: Hsp20/alpha crystallin family protein [Thermodesulfovibrionales bacterium]|nr:Hsp20/alpha crystallin family protein [Thermodesulfovibrionales bacterium]
MKGFFYTNVDTTVLPPVDIYEDETYLYYAVDVPGINPDDITIKVFGDMLLIHGEIQCSGNDFNKTIDYLRVERSSKGFKRMLNIPVPVDIMSGYSTYEKGVLLVRFKKIPSNGISIPINRL